MKEVNFFDIKTPEINYEGVVDQYTEFNAGWDAATTAQEQIKIIQNWDTLYRDIETWESLIYLRFSQETSNKKYQRMRKYCDELRPKLTELDVSLKHKFVSSEYRDQIENKLGKQAFALWENDVASFDPKIKTELVKEAQLEAEYTNLLASAQITFQEEKYNFSQLAKFRTEANRETRYAANQKNWQWFDDNKEQLDQIYDKQVKLRTTMAQKLGYENFIELGYKRMNRIDYTPADVEQFRNSVQENVVPLATELRIQQANKLGVEKVRFWDEGVFDTKGNPAPEGDHDWMLEQGMNMFGKMDKHMKDAFRLMVQGQFLDLKSRKDKAGGGFCTYFPSHGMPYIFANFNGTKGDVEVFTHEFGHAFQSYSSRDKQLSVYHFPTYESCEIHSMSLEFLSWPYMEMFFGDEAEQFRRIHLIQSLQFLPYGVAVDHFQHLVYAAPKATPKERHEMWQEMEKRYLPWRDTGDLPHVSLGGQWQMQSHIYVNPFYYIDYTLAITCALQFWSLSRQDYDVAIKAYIDLCRRGGEVPFQQLVKDTGLISPFEQNCLSDVVDGAHQFLSANHS